MIAARWRQALFAVLMTEIICYFYLDSFTALHLHWQLPHLRFWKANLTKTNLIGSTFYFTGSHSCGRSLGLVGLLSQRDPSAPNQSAISVVLKSAASFVSAVVGAQAIAQLPSCLFRRANIDWQKLSAVPVCLMIVVHELLAFLWQTNKHLLGSQTSIDFDFSCLFKIFSAHVSSCRSIEFPTTAQFKNYLPFFLFHPIANHFTCH